MSKRNNDWKKREGVVYSTQKDFDYQAGGETPSEAVPVHQQLLTVSLDRHQRAGKQVTTVSGFAGPAEDLEKLAKQLKSGCGVGGSVKDSVILIQGNFVEKVLKLLQLDGYRARRH